VLGWWGGVRWHGIAATADGIQVRTRTFEVAAVASGRAGGRPVASGRTCGDPLVAGTLLLDGAGCAPGWQHRPDRARGAHWLLFLGGVAVAAVHRGRARHPVGAAAGAAWSTCRWRR
jgi:hypothetical protein